MSPVHLSNRGQYNNTTGILLYWSKMNQMKLSIMGPLQSATGNTTSAQRLSQHVESEHISCHLVNCCDFEEAADFEEYIKREEISAIVAIHAFRSGRLLMECSIPYGIVLGGTDVNEHYKNMEKMDTMTKAVNKSRFVVAFSKAMRKQTLNLWPDIEDKVYQQPQAVITEPSLTFSFKDHLYHQCNISQDSLIFLLVAGIRPVKDPLYVVNAFAKWHRNNRNCHFVIVGPAIDADLTEKVKSTMKELTGVHIIPALPQPDVQAAMSQSYALVNSSLSEGMSGAILEAMDLGVPVIARDIPGNTAIVQHNKTGLIFDTPQVFIEQVELLIDSEKLHQDLIKNAKEYINSEHDSEKEKATYVKLVSLLYE
ncbi:glycosyltransferase 1 domain-containing protein 1-like [Ptychodera flava]|uniref:glycosyltransferase 1 domain-containing protein 1-like n=1 Tax=Ptychodera flava TaxID=63121 RepID=UPI00396AA9E6